MSTLDTEFWAAAAVPILLILAAVGIWLFHWKTTPRTRIEWIGQSPRRIGVIRTDGQADRVRVGLDSSFDYDLDPDDALALAACMEEAAGYCQPKARTGRPS